MIQRKPGRIPLDATTFASWAELAAGLSLARDELGTRCLFSDLGLGAWRGHWVGRQLYAQLERAFPDELELRIGLESPDHRGGYMGELTDREGRGSYNVLLSYQLASTIVNDVVARGLRWIVVLAPRSSAVEWGHENVLLLRFLAQGLERSGCGIMLVFPSTAAAPDHAWWELRWREPLAAAAPPDGGAVPSTADAAASDLGMFPGIVPAAVLARVGYAPDQAVALPAGSAVLSPRTRGESPPSTAWLAKLGLEQLGPNDRWLQSYVYARDPVPQPDDTVASVLLNAALDRMSEGGYTVALRLLTHARDRARVTPLRGACDALRQNVLLIMRDLARAAEGPLPVERMPPMIEHSLYMSKASALTMTGRAAQAEPLFEHARALPSGRTGSRDRIYLLNVAALNQLQLGRSDEALAIEKTIEEELAAASDTDWHARYINCINLARLFKKRGDVGEAQAYYGRTFSITDGLRTDSDLMYRCLCQAQVEAAKGTDRAATLHWLRAAVHWLAMEVPEALCYRYVEAVTRGRRVDDPTDAVEEVSAGLYTQLAASAERAGIASANATAGEPPHPAPVFSRLDERAPRTTNRAAEVIHAIGADGIGVFVSVEARAGRFSGPEYVRLSVEVWRLVRMLCKATDLPDTCTVIADAQFGVDLPQTLDELAGACLRAGQNALVFDGRRVELDLEHLLLAARVSFPEGVARRELEGDAPRVEYKRYRKPRALTDPERTVLSHITAGSTVAEITAACAPATADEVIAVLRELESDRVLRLEASVAAQ
jgi:hypothetical protein